MSLVLLVTNILSMGFGLFYLKISKIKLRYSFFIIIFMSYLIIIVGVNIYDLYLTMNLNSFDINGDGMFTGSEVSIQQEKALNLVVNDSGRNMIYFTGLVNAILITLLVLLMHVISNYIFRFLRKV